LVVEYQSVSSHKNVAGDPGIDINDDNSSDGSSSGGDEDKDKEDDDDSVNNESWLEGTI